MPDTLPHAPAARPDLSFETRMTQAGRAPLRRHGFVNPPVQRGSTVLHASCEAMDAVHKRSFEQVLTYGTAGGPTHHALEDAIAEVEGGTRCLIVGTGLAAIAVPLLAYLKAGDHCLIGQALSGVPRCDRGGIHRLVALEQLVHHAQPGEEVVGGGR